ncbi:patatin-like phospholipase domain-containing protein 3 [Acanthaster planci]|uniref:Patatin-like phospholipase domain-containing protein 3 n=1 Tax=Acanthaster planci TaxID=133434 RepID=A0A8B7XU07_ACAPL|nr:patatin-like phospholipase domain-containing protein 3 [Acanthaster planci]
MDLAFSGCGFLGIYHIGVASCFKEHAPNLIRNISGASAGALVACCIVADIDFGKATDNVLRLVQKARSRLLGPFHPFFDLHGYMNERMHKVLPDDIHKLASGRLHVSLTRVWDKTNVIVSDFKSKEEVIEAVLCSAFVPCYSGLIPPTFRGTRYWDGGISNNCPVLSPDTVTICPFSGDFDICPSSQEFGDYLQFTSANINIHLTSTNFWRLSRALYPPEPEKLRKLCQQGYDDTLRYLQSHAVVPCNRHLSLSRSQSSSGLSSERRRLSDAQMSLRSTLLSRSSLQSLSTDLQLLQDILEASDNETWEEWNDEDFFEDEDECEDCKIRAEQTMLKGSLPPQVTNAIREAIMLDNTLLNYLFKFKMFKAVSFMALPYVITFETVVLFTVRFAKMLPRVHRDVHRIWKQLMGLIRHMLEHTPAASLLERLSPGDREEFLASITDENLSVSFHEGKTMKMHNHRGWHRHHPRVRGTLPDCVLDTFDLCEDVFPESRSRSTSHLQEGDKYCGNLYDSFDHTIKISFEMEDVIVFHYLKESCLIDVSSPKNSEMVLVDT